MLVQNAVEQSPWASGTAGEMVGKIGVPFCVMVMPVYEFELNRNVRVRLKPMNLETSKHSSLGPQLTGGVPKVMDRSPPVIVFWSTFVTLIGGATLVPL